MSTQKANYIGDCDDTDEDCLLFQALSNTFDSTTADEDSIATRNEDNSQTIARRAERIPSIMKLFLPAISHRDSRHKYNLSYTAATTFNKRSLHGT